MYDDVVMESLPGVVTHVVVDLEFVVITYFLELLFDLVVDALAVSIRVEGLDDVNINVSAPVITAFEFTMLIPKAVFRF